SIGNKELSTTEGLVVFPRYKKRGEHWRLIDGASAFITWLGKQGIKAELSDAGKTTLQLIRALGGLNFINIIAHPELISLLNKMAHKQIKIQTQQGAVPKEYYGRTVEYATLEKLIHNINQSRRWAHFSLQSLINCNVINIGLEVKCTECDQWNWYPVESLSNILVCENCLKEYAFPKAQPTNRRLRWCYRAVGPFNKPDYASGAYTSALAVRFFSGMLGFIDTALTWSPGLNLTLSPTQKEEVDFSLWYQRRRSLRSLYKPNLVFGECKSFGKVTFKDRDIKRLETLASRFPGAILVFATMTETLSNNEKKLISSLALWGREFSDSGETRAPVVILTGTELFALHDLGSAWKEKGEKYSPFADNPHLHSGNVRLLADATQQLYLGLPSYDEWWEQKVERRRKKKSSRKEKGATKRQST
ncbi:MAG: hypothetical protein KAV87_30000, partial [Desulfobacteraceae bacterium]|nr:hypothetical protein [Desulfobacteraceae bacterium]